MFVFTPYFLNHFCPFKEATIITTTTYSAAWQHEQSKRGRHEKREEKSEGKSEKKCERKSGTIPLGGKKRERKEKERKQFDDVDDIDGRERRLSSRKDIFSEGEANKRTDNTQTSVRGPRGRHLGPGKAHQHNKDETCFGTGGWLIRQKEVEIIIVTIDNNLDDTLYLIPFHFSTLRLALPRPSTNNNQNGREVDANADDGDSS